MKVEVVAFRDAVLLDAVIEILRGEGVCRFWNVEDGEPTAPEREGEILIVDRLDALSIGSPDELRLTVNWLATQGYARVVFVARLGKHDTLSESVRRLIEAIQRTVRIRKYLGPTKVHHETVEPSPYIFVETNFHRANQPIFVLAMLENRRRILIPSERKDDLDYIGSLVAEHYESTDGELQLWGRIEQYRYHDGCGQVFNIYPDGRIQRDVGPGSGCESGARLSLGIRF